MKPDKTCLKTMGEHLREWEKNKIAKEIAAGGKTMAEIAEDNCISKTTLYSVKNQRKEFIEAQKLRYLEATPDAVGIQIELIKSFQKADAEVNPILFNAAVKASENNLKSVGIMPSPTSITINQDNRSQILSPAVESVINKLFPSVTGQIGHSIEPVDIEHEEIIE